MEKNISKKKESRVERRKVKVEIRSDDSGEFRIFGMPIVYGKPSEDMGFIEYVKAGAAKKAIATSNARALYGHNSDTLLPLGRQSSGTLILRDTKDGVEMELDPPDTQFARDLEKSIQRGDIGEMSFGFTIGKEEWADLDKTTPKRTILEIDELFDVSFVAFAAYNDTSISLRSLDTSVALRSLEAARKQEAPTEETPEPITITDNEAVFAFEDFEQFERVAQKINELRESTKPTLPDEPQIKKEDQEKPTRTLELPNLDEVEKRISKVDKKIKIMEVKNL